MAIKAVLLEKRLKKSKLIFLELGVWLGVGVVSVEVAHDFVEAIEAV